MNYVGGERIITEQFFSLSNHLNTSPITSSNNHRRGSLRFHLSSRDPRRASSVPLPPFPHPLCSGGSSSGVDLVQGVLVTGSGGGSSSSWVWNIKIASTIMPGLNRERNTIKIKSSLSIEIKNTNMWVCTIRILIKNSILISIWPQSCC